MRKALLLLCALLLTMLIPIESILAQTNKVDKQERKARRELLMSLQNEKEINVIMDMSNVIILGQSESDFIYRESTIYGDEWADLWENEYKPSIYSDFLVALNSLMYDFGYSIRFGTSYNTKYQIRLVVNKISGSGHTSMFVCIEDSKLEKELYSFSIKGRGGQYGSTVNLIGDGFKRAGKDLAIRMNKIFICGKASSFWN